ESGATFPLGTTTVTYTADDGRGNVVTASFDVTVEDNEDPTITTEAKDLPVESDGQGNEEDFHTWIADNGGARATDNCSDVTWTYKINFTTDECGETGSREVTFTAKDAAGNTSETTATFTIEDETAPELG